MVLRVEPATVPVTTPAPIPARPATVRAALVQGRQPAILARPNATRRPARLVRDRQPARPVQDKQPARARPASSRNATRTPAKPARRNVTKPPATPAVRNADKSRVMTRATAPASHASTLTALRPCRHAGVVWIPTRP